MATVSVVRPSTAAVERALRICRGLDYRTEQGSAYECYLAALRLKRLSLPPNIKNYDAVVAELLGIRPRTASADSGRVYLFQHRWGPIEGTGRKTVWNQASREAAKRARDLFQHSPDYNRNDIRAGLRPDASAILSHILSDKKLPPWRAIAAILLRDQSFVDEPGAREGLRNFLGSVSDDDVLTPLPDVDLQRITTDELLGVPLLAQTAEDQYTPEGLPEDIAPRVTTPALLSETASIEVLDIIDDVVIDPRVERMLELAVRTYRAVLLVGPPGGGKNTLLKRLVAKAQLDPSLLGLSAPPERPLTRTPDESWTSFDLVGGPAPTREGLRFAPGAVLDAIQQDRWLLLDETNRADMDKIFGALLTWLSMDEVELGSLQPDGSTRITLGWQITHPESSVTPPEGLAVERPGSEISFKAGGDWRLIGTYNPQDAQRVFRFGVALSRRFAIVPIPPLTPEQFVELLHKQVDDVEDEIEKEVKSRLGALYWAHFQDEATQLGPAVFLRMIDYVRGGLARTPPPRADGAVHGDTQDALNESLIDSTAAATPIQGARPSWLEELVAEAYLIRVGKYVAAFDEETLNDLGQRVQDPGTGREAGLSGPSWDWVIGQRGFVG